MTDTVAVTSRRDCFAGTVTVVTDGTRSQRIRQAPPRGAPRTHASLIGKTVY